MKTDRTQFKSSIFETFLVDTLKQQPDPPRTVSLISVLQALRHRKLFVWLAIGIPLMMAFALFLQFIGSMPGQGVSSEDSYLSLFVAVCAVMFGILPVIGAVRIQRALQTGVSIQARVSRIQFKKRFYPSTIEAADNGETVGILQWACGGEIIETKFFLDLSWVSLIREGSSIRILANTEKCRLLEIICLED